jgi:hypothetical protein
MKLQAEMFAEAGQVGGLEIQLVYYRGLDDARRAIGPATRASSRTR